MSELADREPRVRAAEALLQEAVFASRAAQAATSSLGAAAPAPGTRQCGLGHGPVPLAELELSARARELALELWPTTAAEPRSDEVRALLDAWIREQDALDRARNHFLRDFRARHGRGRSEYEPEIAAAFDGGLEQINAKARERLAACAERIAALAPRG
ncbi:MAG: hypothetical protein EPO68_11330 [Planctomycetota bacterium]|nr:MAG: hypothetical protein EPO68_11330 [Planctomycetota bacterium]